MIGLTMLLLLSAPQDAAKPDPCPTLNTSGGQSDKTIASFTANLSGGDQNVTPTYNWSISAGEISSGQGTPSITVGGLEKDQIVTATAEVGGYDRSCSVMSSASVAME